MFVRGTAGTVAIATFVSVLAASAVSGAIPCEPIQLGPEMLLSGMVGVGYHQPLAASGGLPPYTFAIVSGALPDGLALTDRGDISGVPAHREWGSFTLEATDATGCRGARSFTLQVCFPMELSPPSIIEGAVGELYVQEIAAMGVGSPTMIRLQGGMLPPGLTIQWQGGNRSVLTGTPAAAGLYEFTLEATDEACRFSRTYELQIVDPGGLAVPDGDPGNTSAWMRL